MQYHKNPDNFPRTKQLQDLRSLHAGIKTNEGLEYFTTLPIHNSCQCQKINQKESTGYLKVYDFVLNKKRRRAFFTFCKKN